jgi:hypothetical protein
MFRRSGKQRLIIRGAFSSITFLSFYARTLLMNALFQLYQLVVMDGAIPIEVSVLCVLRREENSRYRLLLVV